MKIKALILSLINIALCIPCRGLTASAAATGFEYAYITETATLYEDTTLTKPISTLPATYFVIVIADGGEASLRVSYLDIDGYIAKTAVERVDYEPKYKYASPTFSITNDGQPANVRSAPDHTASNIVTTLPSGSTGIYYGTVKGTALIPEVGDLWYYVRYSSDPYKYGYIYKSQLTAEVIEPNIIERVEPEPEPYDAPGDGVSYIIVAALTIPALIIMLFVFKKPSTKPRSRRDSESADR